MIQLSQLRLSKITNTNERDEGLVNFLSKHVPSSLVKVNPSSAMGVSPSDTSRQSEPWVVEFVGVIYKAFGDASKVGLLMFLELWLGTYPLSCGAGYGLKHVVFLEL